MTIGREDGVYLGSQANTVDTIQEFQQRAICRSTPQAQIVRLEAITTPKSSARGTPIPSIENTTMRARSSPNTPETEQALSEAESRVGQTSTDIKDTNGPNIFQKLLQTAIRVQYEEELKEGDEYIIHLEMLQCYSTKMQDLFKRAEPQRHTYVQADSLRKRAKALFPPQGSLDIFSQDKANEAMKVVWECLKQYPLVEYQSGLKDQLVRYADEHVLKNSRMIKGASSNGGLKKKEFQELNFLQRLQYVTPEGIHIIMKELLKILFHIKSQEVNNARLSPVKAAAQRRILLPNFGHKTVRSVLQWIYFDKLDFEDAKHLCEVYRLAEELGIIALGETCMQKLSTAAWSSIEDAIAQDISLSTLLEYSKPVDDRTLVQDPLDGAASTVFFYVLTEDHAPTILKELVIKAIVNFGDIQLFNMIGDNISLNLARPLIKALIVRQDMMKIGKELVKAESQAEEKSPNRLCTDIVPAPHTVSMSHDINTTETETSHCRGVTG